MLASAGNLAHGAFGWAVTATGAFTELGIISDQDDTWTSMAWDYTTETLLATTPDQLYTIDPDLLEATLVGPIEGTGVSEDVIVIAMAISGEGRMFSVDIADNVLIEIAPGSGQSEVVGELGFNPSFAQDMDFDHSDGTLYWAGYFGGGNSQILTIDTETGAATSLGNIEGGSELLSFTVAVPHGVQCLLPSAIDWLQVDILAGNVSAGSTQIVTVNLDAQDLDPGVHSATLCIQTNDPGNPLVPVPVELSVVDAIEIFHDRFEPD